MYSPETKRENNIFLSDLVMPRNKRKMFKFQKLSVKYIFIQVLITWSLYSYHVDAPGTPLAHPFGLTPLSLIVGNMSGLLVTRRQITIVLTAIFVAVLAVAVESDRRFSVSRIHLLLRKTLSQPQFQILLDRYRYPWKQRGEPLEFSEELFENVAHFHHLPAARLHI